MRAAGPSLGIENVLVDAPDVYLHNAKAVGSAALLGKLDSVRRRAGIDKLRSMVTS
jgi:hypothetical protein